MSLAIKHWLLKKLQDPKTTPLPSVLRGKGQLAGLAKVCSDLGMNNPLIVTDRMLTKLGLTARVTAGLAAAGMNYAIYDKVRCRPILHWPLVSVFGRITFSHH